MLIQICTARTDLPATGEGIAFVRGETGPAITAMSGNQGFMMGTDRSSGRYIATAAWSDRESYEAHGSLTPGLIGEITRHLGAGEPVVEVFDLAVAHVVKPLRVGYWGGLTRFRIAAGEADRAVERFRDTFVPGFELHQDGLAGLALLVNRETGDGYGLEWYDSLARLRRSRARGEESGELMLAALSTLTIIETAEIQAVIAEAGALSATGRGVRPRRGRRGHGCSSYTDTG